MKKEHDVTKLPRWAQAEIWRLESNLRSMGKRMEEMINRGQNDQSNVIIPYFKEDMQDQYLPKDTRVQFLIPHPWVEDRPGYIEVRHLRENGEDAIDIHGSSPIWIEPGASNCCVIRFRDHNK